MRLSVDKEDGRAQSIDAQRSAVQTYAMANGIRVIEEFVDMGLSGQTDRRTEFRRMIAQATVSEHPVDVVLMYAFSRFARNMRLFLNTVGDLEDADVEVRSITEDFGQGRGRHLGRTITAMIAEQQAQDATLLTCQSRRENARQGFWNGGPIPFGYKSYVARQDGEKSRKMLAVVADEAAIVRRIFDYVADGRGGRWIVKTLNAEGLPLRGARFSNSNMAGILGREHYTGSYHDRTKDDEGTRPDIDDAIEVPCPVIIGRQQFECVQALRAERNPRRTAPHVAAGTTLLTGVATCGMPGCGSGMTIRTGKGGQYAYYACNARVNRGGTCQCPSVRREELDATVLAAIEDQLLAPDRLRALLVDIVQLSDERRVERIEELGRAQAEQTRAKTAINRLLLLFEEGTMCPNDPIFAERMATNRSTLAAATTRIDTLEAQLTKGSDTISDTTIGRFRELLSAKLRSEDSTLRSAYLKMFVSNVQVSAEDIVVSGPIAALEDCVTTGLPRSGPTVPSFDRKCGIMAQLHRTPNR